MFLPCTAPGHQSKKQAQNTTINGSMVHCVLTCVLLLSYLFWLVLQSHLKVLWSRYTCTTCKIQISPLLLAGLPNQTEVLNDTIAFALHFYLCLFHLSVVFLLLWQHCGLQPYIKLWCSHGTFIKRLACQDKIFAEAAENWKTFLKWKHSVKFLLNLQGVLL